jgi:hypothetical protein
MPRGLRLTVKQITSKEGQCFVVLMMSAVFCYILIALAGFYTVMGEPRSVARFLGGPEADIELTKHVRGWDLFVPAAPDEDGAGTFTCFHCGQIHTTAIDHSANRPVTENYNPENMGEREEREPILTKGDQGYYEYASFISVYNGLAVTIECFSTFEDFDLISGSFPKYDNEVIISSKLQKSYDLKIGDGITLSDNYGERVFIITGVSLNGPSIMAALSAADRLSMMPFPHALEARIIIVLENKEDINSVIAQFNDKFGVWGYAINIKEIFYDNWADGFRLGILGATGMVLVITIVLMILITVLVMQIAVYRERKDMGVLKTAGYSTAQLRQQFVLRFLLVSAMGCGMGLALNLVFSDKMMGAALKLAGISTNYAGDKSFITLLGSAVLLCAVTTMLAWLGSRGIREKGMKDLNME